MLVAIRADASASSGVGHAMRCLALAEEFVESGDRVHWIGDLASEPWLVDKVSRIARSITAPSNSELGQADQVLEVGPDLTIVDSYELGETFCSHVQRHSNALVAIIDSASHLMPADMFVAPNVDIISQDIIRDAPILQGARFVLIRKELRHIKTQLGNSLPGRGIETEPLQVAVLMGGTDVNGMVPRIVDSLVSLAVPLSIDAVSRGLPSRPIAEPLLHPGSSRVTWWNAGDDFFTQITEANLVISAAGVSSWEFLYLGLPLALVQVADNQAANYQWMTSERHALGLGRSADLQDSKVLQDSLHNLLKVDLKASQSRNSIIDGFGAKRVVKAARQLVQGRRS